MRSKRLLLLFFLLMLQGCASETDDLEAPAYQYNAAPSMDYMYRSPPPAVERSVR